MYEMRFCLIRFLSWGNAARRTLPWAHGVSSTVHVERHAGNEAGTVRRQKGDRGSDFLGHARASQCVGLFALLQKSGVRFLIHSTALVNVRNDDTWKEERKKETH